MDGYRHPSAAGQIPVTDLQLQYVCTRPGESRPGICRTGIVKDHRDRSAQLTPGAGHHSRRVRQPVIAYGGVQKYTVLWQCNRSTRPPIYTRRLVDRHRRPGVVVHVQQRCSVRVTVIRLCRPLAAAANYHHQRIAPRPTGPVHDLLND